MVIKQKLLSKKSNSGFWPLLSGSSNMYIRYGLMLVMLVALGGCQKQGQSKKLSKQKSDAQMMYHQQEESQNSLFNASKTMQHNKEIDAESVEQAIVDVDYVWTVDVPIPLQAVEKKNYYEASPNLYSVGYATSLEHDALVAFYKQQMELYGWHNWWETDGLESLLLFEKAHKHCAVSIRPGSSKKKQDIIILQKTV